MREDNCGWRPGAACCDSTQQWGGLPHAKIPQMAVREVPGAYELWMICASRGLAVLTVPMADPAAAPVVDRSLRLALDSSPSPFRDVAEITFDLPAGSRVCKAEAVVNEIEDLYPRYAPAVLRFAWHPCGDRSTAEDIVSETFVRVMTRPVRIETRTALAYLLTIARNLHLLEEAQRRVRTKLLITGGAIGLGGLILLSALA
jgi:hypothetical protein